VQARRALIESDGEKLVGDAKQKWGRKKGGGDKKVHQHPKEKERDTDSRVPMPRGRKLISLHTASVDQKLRENLDTLFQRERRYRLRGWGLDRLTDLMTEGALPRHQGWKKLWKFKSGGSQVLS